MNKYLNIGCGNRSLPHWTNIDFVSTQPSILQVDIRDTIPFESESFDGIYHSHVLEHLTPKEANHLIKECFRLLKPSGVLRVVVPNLETIVRQYIACLDAVTFNQTASNIAEYQWAVIELLDQMVRQKSGGKMLDFWQNHPPEAETILQNRMGEEYVRWKNSIAQVTSPPIPTNKQMPKKTTGNFFKNIFKPKVLKGNAIESFENSGEKHRWMYDKFSLKALLKNHGFSGSIEMTAFTSNLNNWQKDLWLDVEDGIIRKPDSLFIEGRKL